MRHSDASRANNIMKKHNAGDYRSYNYATHQFEIYAETPDRRITMRIEEPNKDFDLEEAIMDSDTQMTFDFENKDPEDKFSDDVKLGQQDL